MIKIEVKPKATQYVALTVITLVASALDLAGNVTTQIQHALHKDNRSASSEQQQHAA